MTEVAASRSRMVSHIRSGKHNYLYPSYSAQNPRKTNTIVYEEPGLVRASEMREETDSHLIILSDYVAYCVRILRTNALDHSSSD